jgi:hypothetical protein
MTYKTLIKATSYITSLIIFNGIVYLVAANKPTLMTGYSKLYVMFHVFGSAVNTYILFYCFNKISKPLNLKKALALFYIGMLIGPFISTLMYFMSIYVYAKGGVTLGILSVAIQMAVIVFMVVGIGLCVIGGPINYYLVNRYLEIINSDSDSGIKIQAKSIYKWCGVIAMMLIVICLSFIAGGYYSISKIASMNGLPVKKADELIVRVVALEKLRSGDYDNGIEYLEKEIDLDLATMGRESVNNKGYWRDGVLDYKLNRVKEYRRKYSSHLVDNNIIEMVNNGFDIGK